MGSHLMQLVLHSRHSSSCVRHDLNSRQENVPKARAPFRGIGEVMIEYSLVSLPCAGVVLSLRQGGTLVN